MKLTEDSEVLWPVQLAQFQFKINFHRQVYQALSQALRVPILVQAVASQCRQAHDANTDKVATGKSGKLNGIGPGKVMPSCL